MPAFSPKSLYNPGYGLFFPLLTKRRKNFIGFVALLTKVQKQRPSLTFQLH